MTKDMLKAVFFHVAPWMKYQTLAYGVFKLSAPTKGTTHIKLNFQQTSRRKRRVITEPLYLLNDDIQISYDQFGQKNWAKLFEEGALKVGEIPHLRGNFEGFIGAGYEWRNAQQEAMPVTISNKFGGKLDFDIHLFSKGSDRQICLQPLVPGASCVNSDLFINDIKPWLYHNIRSAELNHILIRHKRETREKELVREPS